MDILGAEAFSDGEQVTGARLNNHVNAATIQSAFVTSKTSVTPAGGDSILLYDLSGTNLARTTVTNLMALSGAGTVTSVGLNLPTDTFVLGGDVTTAGDLVGTYKVQNAGEVHIAPVASTADPTWRRLEARDMWLDTVNIAAAAIDWNLGNTFYKIITGPGTTTFQFTNTVAGRSIEVFVGQSSPATGVVTWNGTAQGLVFIWEGSTPPTQTTGNGKWDWYRFTRLYSSYVFGVRLAANMSP